MKKLLFFLSLILSLSAAAQTQSALPVGSVPYGTQYYIAPDGGVWVGSSTKKFRNIGTKHRVDSLLALKQGALTITTTGTSGPAGLVGNTLNIPQYSGGGGGGITSVTSSTADVTVTNTTTAPVITSIVTGTAANQLVRRGFAGGIDLSYIAGIAITPDNTTHAINYYSGTGGYGGHKFYVGGSTVLRAQIDVSGNWIVNNLATGGTAPATTGTKKMVVTDANGLFSFDNIPGGSSFITSLTTTGSSGPATVSSGVLNIPQYPGGGGVSSFGKVDGLGISSSVANSTTTPVHTISVDTTVIPHKDFVTKRYTVGVKDFYVDSVELNETSPTVIYADTIPANKLVKNGDKLVMFVAGALDVDASPGADHRLRFYFGGTQMITLTITGAAIGRTSYEVTLTLMRANSNTVRASASLISSEISGPGKATVSFYSGSGFDFTAANTIQLRGDQSSSGLGSLEARMGYIEYKPAAF